MKNHPKIYTKLFAEDVQTLLYRVDFACSQQYKNIQEEIDAASLAGDKEFKLDLESIVWLEIAKAYGILYNRAVDEGWVKGVLTDNELRKATKEALH